MMFQKYLTIKVGLLLLIVITISSSTFNNTEKSEEIINKYLEAIGGLDKIKKITTYQSKGVFVTPNENLNYELYTEIKDRISIFVKGNSLYEKTLYTKDSTLSNVNDSIYVLKNINVIKSYEIESWIIPLAYKDLIKKTKYNGTIVIDGISCEKITVLFYNDIEWTVFFDKKTHLIYQIITSSGLSSILKNYKEVNNILFPHEFLVTISNQPGAYKLILHSIYINKKIPESKFKIKN